MKLKLVFLTLITGLISSCTLATPKGEYRIIPDEFDHTFIGDFDVNIKGKNNQPGDTCPTRAKGNTYYVAIALTPPIGQTCTLEGIRYSIYPIEFNSIESAREFANARAYELGLDTIYGTNEPRPTATAPSQN